MNKQNRKTHTKADYQYGKKHILVLFQSTERRTSFEYICNRMSQVGVVMHGFREIVKIQTYIPFIRHMFDIQEIHVYCSIANSVQ